LARLIQAEAGNQPFLVQLCVGDIVLNRLHASQFPHHLAAVIQQPGQFSSVSNGTFARAVPTTKALRAARNAMEGWNPVRGDLYYYNPSLPHNAWMNTLPGCQRIGAMAFFF
jgi:N-acetylmuramoyl-L-alanine amidase